MASGPRRRVAIATLAPPGECCPYLHEAVELVGKRWTGAIVYVLLEGGNMRFSEIGSAVPNLSDRLLSERMKELEARGIVEREVREGSPARVEYTLTDMGRDVEAVRHWKTYLQVDSQSERAAYARRQIA